MSLRIIDLSVPLIIHIQLVEQGLLMPNATAYFDTTCMLTSCFVEEWTV